MKRIFPLLAAAALLAGCTKTDPIVVDTFRGNPIGGEQTVANQTLTATGGPYLVTDTLVVGPGKNLTIEAGTEVRFEIGIPMIVYGKITALGSEIAPITFTSGSRNPIRGDWDGIWMISADPTSRFEYCRFLFGAKFGRRYTYRTTNGELDSTRIEYGCLTLINSSPTVTRSWFLASGFHGLLCDSSARPTVTNSIFYDNAGHGIFIGETADPDSIDYNIISENDDYGVFCQMPGETRRADLNLNYNIIIENFSGEYNQNAPLAFGRIAQANGNLDSCDFRFNLRLNPEFRDASKIKNGVSWDFHLQPWSSAIDAGQVAVNMEADGTRLDLGVYHYQYRPGEIRRLVTVPEFTAANSPYYLTSEIYLPTGQNLTIQPGVEIRVEGRFQFRIKGRVLFQGTQANPIRIYSAAENPIKGDWSGVVFEAGGNPSSVIQYTEISHARWGIRLISQDALIDHCTISDCDSVGIFCDNLSSPEIRDCRFINNAIAGILCQFNSSPEITRNRISGGQGYGIYALGSSRPRIENNVIWNVGTDGIRLENLSNAVLNNNVVASNGYHGLLCSNNASPDVRNNIFFRNGTDLRGGMGIYAERSSFPTIEYNVFWGNARNAVWISGDDSLGVTNLTTDPDFANPAGADYHQRNPLCRDAGDPAPIYNDPDGSRNDIGAYGGPNAG